MVVCLTSALCPEAYIAQMDEKTNPSDEDVDARLKAESLKLLEEMEALMKRTRILILDRERLVAVIKEKRGGEEK